MTAPKLSSNIIVIGASAGGVEALSTLVSGLTKNFRAAVLVVLHLEAGGRSHLPAILARSSALNARTATPGALIEPGVIYVAPNDQHLLVDGDRITLSRGPKVNLTRPAVDVLFRSAAEAYGDRVLGVLLSGTLDDGAAGLQAIKRAGGVAVVQDPDDALFPDMPSNAVARGPIDYILPVAEIAPLLERLVRGPGAVEESTVSTKPDDDGAESAVIAHTFEAQRQGERDGQPSILTCPDCGGVVWEFGDQSALRYRCHVGHEYSWQSMASGQSDVVEVALWGAVRLLEEQATLKRRVARAVSTVDSEDAAAFQAEASGAERRADVIRGLIFGEDGDVAKDGG